ncbi:MAG: Gfo/Idh/MocA family oxidoreductase [Clostridiales bacterium]|nr:Gfo/Idh/MocA family oxidoreductase [Clostridiales bacterium]
MVNILMLSKWHVHAKDYARQIQEQDDARITCVWDDDVSRGASWAKELGVPFEPDLDKALARKDVDAVVVDTPTTQHKTVMLKAARAGKHIFTEKALATTMEDAKAIAKAIQENGVQFCISYPQLTSPLVQLCKQTLDEGLLGDVHYLRFRMAHNGARAGWLPEYWYNVEDAGGGAMMDLGCHPMYIASYLLGRPARVCSMFNNNHAPQGVDDNAVSVIEFENKAIAVLETGFISPYNGNCFELLGTKGAIVSVNGQVKMRTKDCKDGWFTPDKLPTPLPSAMRMWLDGIVKGTEIPFNLQRAMDLTELLEHAYLADREQRVVPFAD